MSTHRLVNVRGTQLWPATVHLLSPILGIAGANFAAKSLKQRTILFKLIDIAVMVPICLEKIIFSMKGAEHVGASHVEPGAESQGRSRAVA